MCYQKTFRNHNNLNCDRIFRAKRQVSLILLNRTAALPAALSNLLVTRPWTNYTVKEDERGRNSWRQRVREWSSCCRQPLLYGQPMNERTRYFTQCTTCFRRCWSWPNSSLSSLSFSATGVATWPDDVSRDVLLTSFPDGGVVPQLLMLESALVALDDDEMLFSLDHFPRPLYCKERYTLVDQVVHPVIESAYQ